MADLETSLASQRLAIHAQCAQQPKQMQGSAEQSASGVLTGLTSYIESLQTGSASPLNAQSQYGLRNRNSIKRRRLQRVVTARRYRR